MKTIYGRAQATTKAGAKRIRIVFPRTETGEFTPKIVPVTKTYGKAIYGKANTVRFHIPRYERCS